MIPDSVLARMTSGLGAGGTSVLGGSPSIINVGPQATPTGGSLTQDDLDNLPGIGAAARPYRPSYASGGVFGFSKGAGRVPGKGSGKVDTVPAMLAPGEAVLNKEAAERVGRGTIDVLNAIGLHDRGEGGQAPTLQADGESGSTGVLHAARGTSKVKGKAPAAGGARPMPASVNPAVLQAIMGGLGGA